ncbi:MAG: hypothetical protein VXW65_06150 [Pseudomonadota bacterium]|nr:hypothetical protein [Pseudomonadota bacterium]
MELSEPWMASLPSTKAFAYFWPVKSEASRRRNTGLKLHVTIAYLKNRFFDALAHAIFDLV